MACDGERRRDYQSLGSTSPKRSGRADAPPRYGRPFFKKSPTLNRDLGSITHLLFPSRSHLLSASEDGTLCLFHARDWTVLRTMKGHKARINSVAVHPSGKVALSVGKDRTLRMWDLMRGKGVASTKLGKGGVSALFSVSPPGLT